ncbi:hypothetical protein DH2020_046050 [Rehmannia glutinosa]|uniref:Myb/SANT-like domain-containing protein n=1 Tax=Rehmannia glutinosa TaxID=99300 RepID=A0ABR0UC91_REHGL
MDLSSNNFGIVNKPVRKMNDKGRRSWSRREEEALIVSLKEVIASGWKSENGFKIGYLQALEQEMQKIIPGTDLKGIPHINSKIHVWKKDYGSLVTMLSRSGIGWNVSTNTIEAPDDAWAEYIKDFTEALNHVLNGMSIPQEDTPINLENLSENGEDETETNSFCQAESTPQTSRREKEG